MANLRSSAPGSRSRGAAVRTEQTPDTEASEYLGVSESDAQEDPSLIGEVFRGVVFKKINVPSRVAAGETFTVTGVVKLDAAPLVKRAARVRLESPITGEQVTDLGTLSNGDTKSFSFSLTAPDQPGSTGSVKLFGEYGDNFGGYSTSDESGPQRFEIVTSQAKTVDSLLSLAPSIIGGGAAGWGASRVLDRPLESRRYTIAGAALGGATQFYFDRFDPLGTVSLPSLPVYQLAAVGAAGFGVAALLSATGASDVLGALGETAGTAVDQGRRAVSSGRRAVNGAA